MNMTEYVYKFDDGILDKLAHLFESRIGGSSGDYEEDYLDMVKFLLQLKNRGSLLDIGAGVGRLIFTAKNIVSEIVALEPDESRWLQCHRVHNNAPKCEVLCTTTAEYLSENPERKFDLIVISMVLQHISTGDSERLLKDASTLLSESGLVVIFTTHSPEESSGFSFSGESREMYVSRNEFNEYASGRHNQQTRGLPVRRFSKSQLLASVSKCLEPIYWRQCAYYTAEGLNFFAKRLQIDPEKLRDVGSSQFVIARNRN